MNDVQSTEQSVDVDELRRENEALRQRIAELEASDARRLEDEVRALRERLQLLDSVLDNSPSIIFVKALDGRYLFVNRHTARLYRTLRDDLLHRYDTDFFPPDVVAIMQAKDQEALARGGPITFEESIVFEGELRDYITIKFPIMGLDGAPMGVCGIATDITEQKRQAAEHLRMREQVITAQEEALRELSTPLVPIAERVMAMPLVGAIDCQRADLILSALLDGVSHQGAHTVIVDITGVRTVDARVAETLVMAARAVGLLGARVIVTGVRPEVARTLVELGTDLQGIVTKATLQSGIAHALGRK